MFRSRAKRSTGAFRDPAHQWFQGESGLHQRGMRGYDPVTGSYLQPDPLGLVDGPAVYSYAMGAPGVYTDRWGLEISGRNNTDRITDFHRNRDRSNGGITYGIYIYFRGIFRCSVYCRIDNFEAVYKTAKELIIEAEQNEALRKCLRKAVADYVKKHPGTAAGRVGTGVAIGAVNPYVGVGMTGTAWAGDLTYAAARGLSVASMISISMTGDPDGIKDEIICEFIQIYSKNWDYI